MSETETRPGAEGHRYPQIVAFVRDTPWEILPSKLREITSMLEVHIRGQKLTAEEIQARIGAPARRDAQTKAVVAVIPVYGVITPKADLMTEMSGGTSIDRLQQSLRAAVADDKVSAIVLDIDSPGGSVSMLTEMAAEIRAARRVKPVVAVANTMAASAAYHLASQASEVVVTPSGSVGSIGTLAAHEDISSAMEMEGVKTTVVTSSKFKGELSPFEPLSADAKAQLQNVVDQHGRTFEQDVARGRGVPVERVRSDFGQGRMLLAKDALKAGMVDRIDTLDNVVGGLLKNVTLSAVGTPQALINAFDAATTVTETRAFADYVIQSVQQEGSPPGEPDNQQDHEAAMSGLSFADEAEALRDSAEALVDRTRSLAEYRDRGHLSVSKRERLAACTEALRASLTALDEVLAATQPVDHQAAFLAQRARYERSRYEGATR